MITLGIMTMLGAQGVAEGLTSSLGTQVILLIIAELLMLCIIAVKQRDKK